MLPQEPREAACSGLDATVRAVSWRRSQLASQVLREIFACSYSDACRHCRGSLLTAGGGGRQGSSILVVRANQGLRSTNEGLRVSARNIRGGGVQHEGGREIFIVVNFGGVMLKLKLSRASWNIKIRKEEEALPAFLTALSATFTTPTDRPPAHPTFPSAREQRQLKLRAKWMDSKRNIRNQSTLKIL